MSTSAPASLQGWQYSDSSRSSWDILWSCLSTMFACTWTALHLGVPRSHASIGRIFSKKVLYWFLTVLYPELLLISPAADDYLKAKMTLARFNAAQAEIDKKREQTRSSLNEAQPRPLSSEGEEATSKLAEWTMVHAFCVNMRGLVLRTTDTHIYTVQSKHVETLVKCGIIKYPQFSERDIEDRSKADSLAKVVSLIQSTWTVINVVSRAAYHLPITLLEIATMAFILCAYSSYVLWWNKPKDMNAPIIIHLPYKHDSDKMAPELRSLLDENREEWIEYQPSVAEKESWVAWRLLVMACKNPIHTLHIFKDRMGSLSQQKLEHQTRDLRPEEVPPREIFSTSAELLSNFIVFFVSLGFSAIHIAAWDFAFPTEAEKIAWRVLAIVSFSLCLPVYLVMQLPYFRGWLARLDIPGLPSYVNPYPSETKAEGSLLAILFATYGLARLGCFALMFMSLRALPARCYTDVPWLKSVPHV